MADCGDTPGPIGTLRNDPASVVQVGVLVATGPKTLKSTVPETVAVPGVRVTVAVSVAEPPKVMVEGETVVDIEALMTTRVSPASPHVVETMLPLTRLAGL